jgi:outer membrane protein TolC
MNIYPILRDVWCVLGLALLGGWQVGALAVAAPVDAEPRLELTSLVREVMENNPDIRAAQQRSMATRAVIPQVRTLPDPMVNLGYMYDGETCQRSMSSGAGTPRSNFKGERAR